CRKRSRSSSLRSRFGSKGPKIFRPMPKRPLGLTLLRSGERWISLRRYAKGVSRQLVIGGEGEPRRLAHTCRVEATNSVRRDNLLQRHCEGRRPDDFRAAKNERDERICS